MNPPTEYTSVEDRERPGVRDANRDESDAVAAATAVVTGTKSDDVQHGQEDGPTATLPSPSSPSKSVSSPGADESLASKKSVRFDPSASAPSSAAPGPPPRRKPRLHPDAIPRRLSPAKVGKANPVRDLCLFLGFIAIGLYMTYDYGHPEPSKSNVMETMEKAAETVNQMTDALAKLAQKHYERSKTLRPDLPCSVYASPSTVPGAGIGLFAGRDYADGETIPISIGGSESDLQLIPLPMESENFVLWVPAHTLLMKHHPILANVRGTLYVTDSERRRRGASNADTDADSFRLTASHPIAAGSELFASLVAHPHGYLLERQRDSNEGPRHATALSLLSRFAHIPTANEYELANNIWDDADLAVRRMRLVHKLAQVHCGTWFATLAGSVSRIHPTVGSLLPTSQPNHERGSQTTALVSLKNQTVLQLRVKGSCLGEDVMYETASSSSSPMRSRHAVAGRIIKKGSVVTRIPLHAVRAQSDRAFSCTSSNGPSEGYSHECYTYDDPSHLPRFGDKEGSRVVLYPLAHAGFFLPPDHSQHQDEASNVELQWTDVPWSTHPDRSSIQDILTSPPGSLMWNVVATADIAEGEELVLPPSAIASLLPEHWRQPKDDAR